MPTAELDSGFEKGPICLNLTVILNLRHIRQKDTNSSLWRYQPLGVCAVPCCAANSRLGEGYTNLSWKL